MNDTDKTKEDTGVHEEPRVMSRDDVHDYEGLTLNEDGKEEKQEEPDYKQKMLDGHKNIDAVTNAIDKIAD